MFQKRKGSRQSNEKQREHPSGSMKWRKEERKLLFEKVAGMISGKPDLDDSKKMKAILIEEAEGLCWYLTVSLQGH